MYYYTYQMKPGRITIAEKDGYISEVGFSDGGDGKADWIWKETPLIAEAGKQLEEYFEGRRREFHLPLMPEGTAFQKKVWNALLTIPYGEVRTYGQIAEQVGNPKACRAVGMANHHNPIGIIIPCHRVIGRNGKLTGYAGGLDKKEWLLRMEGGYDWQTVGNHLSFTIEKKCDGGGAGRTF